MTTHTYRPDEVVRFNDHTKGLFGEDNKHFIGEHTITKTEFSAEGVQWMTLKGRRGWVSSGQIEPAKVLN